MSHPPLEGSRDTRDGLVISKYPDVCRSPTAPVPYTIVAYQSDDANTCATVRLTGQRAHNQGSIITRCTGDEPGTGLGVKSNTVSSVCHRKEHSATVRFEGKPATRHNDEWFMNNRNTIGKLTWFTGNEAFEPTPPIRYAALASKTMSDASPAASGGSEPRVQLAQAAAAQAQPLPANPGTQPRPSNPITPNNPQPGRAPSGQTPAPANDNPRPAPPSRWWNLLKIPLRIRKATGIGLALDLFFQQNPAYFDDMVTRDDAERGNIKDAQGQIDNGADPQEVRQWARREIENHRRQQTQPEERTDAPPVPNTRTEENVSVRRRRRRRDCRLRPYREGCPNPASSTPHHVVPDRVFRSPSGAYYDGGVRHADGLTLCVDGGTPIRQGPNANEHGRIHGLYDPIERQMGLAGHPTGTAPLGRLEALGVSSAAAITGCNPVTMAAQLRAYHAARGLGLNTPFRADPTGRINVDPSTVGRGATPRGRGGL